MAAGTHERLRMQLVLHRLVGEAGAADAQADILRRGRDALPLEAAATASPGPTRWVQPLLAGATL
jgi:hypothetical protein